MLIYQFVFKEQYQDGFPIFKMKMELRLKGGG